MFYAAQFPHKIRKHARSYILRSRMEFDMAFQLKGNRKETENKTIRFPWFI